VRAVLVKPVTLAADGNELEVGQEAVEDGGGCENVLEKLRPVLGRSVGGMVRVFSVRTAAKSLETSSRLSTSGSLFSVFGKGMCSTDPSRCSVFPWRNRRAQTV
jgi:hypothetical protein